MHAVLALVFVLSSHAQSGNFKPQVIVPDQPAKPADTPPTPPAASKPASKGEDPFAQGQDGGGGAGGSPGLQDLLKNFGNGAGDGHYDGPTGAGGEYFGPGKVETCGSVPGSTAKALEDAKTFREACPPAKRGESQRIAVADYSMRPSYLYIFDLNGQCLGRTMVAFGNGAGGAQVACADANSHLTPPGFHLTSTHDGAKYGRHNSLGLVGLQGQGSSSRAILIHPARAPGTSSTWGCLGVGYEAFNAVKSTLGLGALVYNYFPPNQLAASCRSRAGISPNGPRCQMDPSSPSIPNEATGQGTPAVASRLALIPEAYASKMPERLKIKKGTEISIYRHLPKSDTYEITMIKEEAQGPNVVTPEELKKALDVEGSVKDFKKRLARDTGAIYVLKKDLPLLWEEEIYRRAQKKAGR